MRVGCQILAIVAFAVAARPGPALAEEEGGEKSDLAMKIFEAGRAYYDQGNYAKALEQFEEAYRLQPLADLLYNIGQCHERLQDYPKAIEAYGLYLEENPTAEDRQAVLEKIKNLEAKLAMTGIVLAVTEDGAAIRIDGEEVATSPVASLIRTDPGTHELEVSKEGFQTVVMKFTVPPGVTQELSVQLVAIPEEPAAGKKPTWFTWTYGTGALVGLAAVGTGVAALKIAGQARDASSEGDNDLYWEKRNLSKKLAISTDVFIGVGAALVVASTAGLIAWSARSRKNKERPEHASASWTLVPAASPLGAGLALEVDF